MILLVASTRIEKINLIIALVDSEFIGKPGDVIIRKLAVFYPVLPAMLICVADNGFLAHADFQTARLLALLQLEKMSFSQIDLDNPPELELPF